ncbi:hypothetical protein [Lacipirellula sp.]|uniref:hypothetical protein n=1 Tax=Lacipirellula sp. TaxID=2691419 RepID=UPI003D0A4B81
MAQARKPAAQAATKPTRKTFEAYLKARENRLAKSREAGAFERQEKRLAAEITRYIEQEGGPERIVKCCGHRASITTEPGRVSWAQEFERAMGHDEAERLRQHPPDSDKLNVVAL